MGRAQGLIRSASIVEFWHEHQGQGRLLWLLIQTTHEERAEIDKEVEHRTRESRETGVDKISDQELREIVEYVRRKRKPAPKEMMAVA